MPATTVMGDQNSIVDINCLLESFDKKKDSQPSSPFRSIGLWDKLCTMEQQQDCSGNPNFTYEVIHKLT